MTRRERDEAVEALLERYEPLGAVIVDDDETLCRLLQTLELSGRDAPVGEYLCSYLIP